MKLTSVCATMSHAMCMDGVGTTRSKIRTHFRAHEGSLAPSLTLDLISRAHAVCSNCTEPRSREKREEISSTTRADDILSLSTASVPRGSQAVSGSHRPPLYIHTYMYTQLGHPARHITWVQRYGRARSTGTAPWSWRRSLAWAVGDTHRRASSLCQR